MSKADGEAAMRILEARQRKNKQENKRNTALTRLLVRSPCLRGLRLPRLGVATPVSFVIAFCFFSPPPKTVSFLASVASWNSPVRKTLSSSSSGHGERGVASSSIHGAHWVAFVYACSTARRIILSLLVRLSMYGHADKKSQRLPVAGGTCRCVCRNVNVIAPAQPTT